MLRVALYPPLPPHGVMAGVRVFLCACLLLSVSFIHQVSADQEPSSPKEMAWWTEQGREFLRAGEHLRAESAFKKVLDAVQKESSAEAAIVAMSMGYLFFDHRRFDESYSFHSRGISLLVKLSPGPHAGRKILSVGNRYLERGLASAAMQFYLRIGNWAGDAVQQERAVKIAMGLNALGDPVAAMATLRKFMKRHEDPQGKLLFNLAWIQHQSKQNAKALQGFLRVAREHPKAEWADAALYYAAKARLAQHKPEEAKKLLEKFSTDYPDSDLKDKAKLMMGKLAEPSS